MKPEYYKKQIRLVELKKQSMEENFPILSRVFAICAYRRLVEKMKVEMDK